MNGVCWWLGQNAITILFLVPVVAALCCVFRNRPAVQHVLWVVVLFKFITPPVVFWPMPISGLWFTGEPPTLASSSATTLQDFGFTSNGAAFHAHEHRSAEISQEIDGLKAREASFASRAQPATSRFTEGSLYALAAGWLIGLVACAIKQGRRIGRRELVSSRLDAATGKLLDHAVHFSNARDRHVE